jgi:4-aminobutyrate aminotransferase-like enzyme
MKKNFYIKTKNRFIHTVIPAPGTKSLFKSLSKVESRSMHGQMPIAWDKAKNFNIFDIAGNKFIDFTSTIFVANIGHSNSTLVKYIKLALRKNLLHSYAYINKVREKYLKKLILFAGKNFQKAFLMSAGTEATEAALKLMRMNGQKQGKRKLGIICFEGNWHGRTMGAQMMSGNIKQKEWIGYQDPNIYHLPFPYPWILKNTNPEQFLINSLKKLSKKINLKKDICGVMIETFQGWGAVYYPKKYIKLLYKICKKNNILLAFDEMQSGFARTGYKFGYEYYGVKPDLICCGKGMGGGIPISGVIGKRAIMDLPEVGNMSSTHSANPLACYAGLAVLEEINKKKLLQNTKYKEKILFTKLNQIKDKFPKEILYVQGKGLIAALIFDLNSTNNIKKILKSIVEKCLRQGLLVVYTGRESIKIGPPLTITKSALIEGINVLDKAITEELTKIYK